MMKRKLTSDARAWRNRRRSVVAIAAATTMSRRRRRRHCYRRHTAVVVAAAAAATNRPLCLEAFASATLAGTRRLLLRAAIARARARARFQATLSDFGHRRRSAACGRRPAPFALALWPRRWFIVPRARALAVAERRQTRACASRRVQGELRASERAAPLLAVVALSLFQLALVSLSPAAAVAKPLESVCREEKKWG